jgi:hypothetical protein
LQTKLGSIVEAWANIAVGFTINFIGNLLVWPLLGIHGVGAQVAFTAGLIFTAISLVRQYVIRRWFNCFKLEKFNASR